MVLAPDSGDQVTLCCFKWCMHMVQQAEHCSSSVLIPGSIMAQVVSCRPVTVKARVQFQASPIWGLWWTKWHWERFFSQHLRFPVSIILPLLHTHSFIYHQCCIMFFSQYFSFHLSVSFHHCSILIHPSTTHTL